MTDSRKIFYDSWIKESPQRTKPRNDLSAITRSIDEFSEYYQEEQLPNGLYKLATNDKLFIYGKLNDTIVIAVEFEIMSGNLSVVSSAKSQEISNQSPYMSEVYLTALRVAKSKSIRFESDKTLTDDGFKVWARLLTAGHTISVYDTTNPGQSLTTISTVDDLRQFWDYDINFRRYKFILSEDKRHWLDTVYSPFSTRRLRELADITLDDEYKEKTNDNTIPRPIQIYGRLRPNGQQV
jgi:hypothetical protein